MARSPAAEHPSDYILGEPPVRPSALMRPYGLYYIYRNRLRYHLPQELFAGLGIVIGVALVFATLVGSSSISGSAARVVEKVAGRAQLELRSISSEGFSESTLTSLEGIPGIRAAAPLLEVPASVQGAGGRQLNVTVLGADVSLGVIDGLSHTVPGAVFSERALALSAASASELGITPAAVESPGGAHVLVKIRGGAYPLKVSAVLGAEALGALSGVLAAAMPLEDLQFIAGLKGRVSRILIQAAPGQRDRVQAALRRLAAGRISVVGAHQEVALLDQVLAPGNLASSFFAAVAALLGFLLAFNAVLLTAPERRAQIADLRLAGARPTALIELMLFQALCLGLLASLIGLGAGWGLALALFHQRPGYLAQAFVLGEGVLIGPGPALYAIAGGLLATFLASLVPVADLRRGRAIDAIFRAEGDQGNALGATLPLRLAAAAVVLIALATVILIEAPSLALIACVALALACVAAMPLAFFAVVQAGAFIARHSERLTILPVAVMSLRRTTLRSLALVSTGAVALFGAVALEGARGDLFSGLEGLGRANASAGQIAVINPGDVEVTDSFRAGGIAARIAHLPAVRSVQVLQDSFLDIGNERAVIFARAQRTGRQLLQTQLVSGNVNEVERKLTEGGWIALTRQLAEKLHARLGGEINLPVPTGPARLRVAGLTTNFGWPGGGIMMSASEFSRLWGSSAPSALVVDVTPGADLGRVRGQIAAALGAGSGLEVISAQTGYDRFILAADEGLGELQWISLMLVIASILAMATALSADIWQQRPWLADLRLSSVPSYRLRRIMLMKVALTLGAGCLAGLLAGLYGQAIADTYLKHVTGFPLASFASAGLALETFAIVVGATLLIAALPIWLGSRVPLIVGLGEH